MLAFSFCSIFAIVALLSSRTKVLASCSLSSLGEGDGHSERSSSFTLVRPVLNMATKSHRVLRESALSAYGTESTRVCVCVCVCEFHHLAHLPPFICIAYVNPGCLKQIMHLFTCFFVRRQLSRKVDSMGLNPRKPSNQSMTPPPKSVFNKVKPRSIPDHGPKPRRKPVSVSIIPVVVYSVCQ